MSLQYQNSDCWTGSRSRPFLMKSPEVHERVSFALMAYWHNSTGNNLSVLSTLIYLSLSACFIFIYSTTLSNGWSNVLHSNQGSHLTAGHPSIHSKAYQMHYLIYVKSSYHYCHYTQLWRKRAYSLHSLSTVPLSLPPLQYYLYTTTLTGHSYIMYPTTVTPNPLTFALVPSFLLLLSFDSGCSHHGQRIHRHVARITIHLEGTHLNGRRAPRVVRAALSIAIAIHHLLYRASLGSTLPPSELATVQSPR